MSNFNPLPVTVHTNDNQAVLDVIANDADLRNRHAEEQAALKIACYEREERLRSARDQINAEIRDLRESAKTLNQEITDAGSKLAKDHPERLDGYDLLRDAASVLNAVEGHAGDTVDNEVADGNLYKFDVQVRAVRRDDANRTFRLRGAVVWVDNNGVNRDYVLERATDVAYSEAVVDILERLIDTNKRLEDAENRASQVAELLAGAGRWRQGREAMLAKAQLESTDRGRKFLESVRDSGDDVQKLLTAQV